MNKSKCIIIQLSNFLTFLGSFFYLRHFTLLTEENPKLGNFEKQFGLGSGIRKASLFARGRKRDSEEIVLLKMMDLGGGRHPVRAVRSTPLPRPVVWAGPLNSVLGPGRRGIS